ncbi:hypothetical protein GCM10016272_22070 [Psychrobacter glaciei]|uniref:Uncharacterized protein n=1 Tax=Psychrobacter glaciei TaxID=619771 RepID=A0ABQ3GTH8_9GAMM|nr:hypothetical protein [Psychrobacter glaciei]GHD35779.1 hypothetical protein GCM10016272_22070 [Psychrobacter glaciei]
MKEVIRNSKKAFTSSKNPVSNAAKGFEMLVNAYADYKTVCQTEHTKREAISAWREVQLSKTNNQREFLESYLKERFIERRHVIDEMFHRLDQGIESDNPELISMAMTAIQNTVQSSPLQEASNVLMAMNDPSVDRIEF